MNKQERKAFGAFVESIKKTQLPGLDGMFAVGMIFLPTRPLPGQPSRICCVWLDQVSVKDRKEILRVIYEGFDQRNQDSPDDGMGPR
jgi:hypothetical protein